MKDIIFYVFYVRFSLLGTLTLDLCTEVVMSSSDSENGSQGSTTAYATLDACDDEFHRLLIMRHERKLVTHIVWFLIILILGSVLVPFGKELLALLLR